MMVQIEPFRAFLVQQGKSAGTASSYCSHVRRVDEKIGGVDEVLRAGGLEGVTGWLAGNRSVTSNDERSAVAQYLRFASSGDFDAPSEVAVSDVNSDTQRVVFSLERDLNEALRKNVAFLELGLKPIDNGFEVSVATGRIDVLAKDQLGQLVVIELKAGPCPTGALEQALGYAQSVSEEYGTDNVRVILIAASFSERLRAAARRTHGVELREYEFDLKFHRVT